MIGNQYYSHGIKVKPYLTAGEYLWHVKCGFQDVGWNNDDASEGELQNRYSLASLTAAIDNIKRDVERLGIQWDAIEGMTPTIYMHVDGLDKETAYPENWRVLIAAQCARLGWRCLYADNA